MNEQLSDLPFVPVGDANMFPGSVFSVHVARERYTASIDRALTGDFRIALGFEAQGSDSLDSLPDSVAVLAQITHSVRSSSGELRVRVHVLHRIQIQDVSEGDPVVLVSAIPCDDPIDFELTKEDEERLQSLKQSLSIMAAYDPMVDEYIGAAEDVYHPGVLADLVASTLPLSEEEALSVLRELDPRRRIELVADFVEHYLDREALRDRIAQQIDSELQREEYEQLLREQLKQIRTELGDTNDWDDDISDLQEHLKKQRIPKQARDEAQKQIRRLQQLHPDTAEAALARTYLDWIVDLPWSKRTRDKLVLEEVRTTLDGDHFGLDETKERILDFLSVRKLSKDLKGPVILLVGPPGVGKTSLGRSIAKAMGRRFVRVSVGGLRDESELRGHRKTYVGAMPGRIIQGLKTAKSKNPVLLIDEIDKIGNDFRGDPASVLLEVLDPEQNSSFEDHYLNLPFDLSEVMFIATANVTDTIPPALHDRMEVIEVSGYALEEKVEICKRYLIPRSKKENGLENLEVAIDDAAVNKLIRGYTRESGVRELGRVVSRLFRKIARRVAEGAEPPTQIDVTLVADVLGPEEFVDDEALPEKLVGVATGLAWTAVGGETLVVEAAITPGRGNVKLTGQLGEVMQESAQAALTYIMSNAASLSVDPDFLQHTNVHIHVPHGAIPKDGPSAGVTIATALVSLLTDRPASQKVAMTGEITLRGRVLEIGGLREKALAAKRAGIPTVVIPFANKREIASFPSFLTEGVQFVAVRELQEVFDLVLLDGPKQRRRRRRGRVITV